MSENGGLDAEEGTRHAVFRTVEEFLNGWDSLHWQDFMERWRAANFSAIHSVASACAPSHARNPAQVDLNSRALFGKFCAAWNMILTSSSYSLEKKAASLFGLVALHASQNLEPQELIRMPSHALRAALGTAQEAAQRGQTDAVVALRTILTRSIVRHVVTMADVDTLTNLKESGSDLLSLEFKANGFALKPAKRAKSSPRDRRKRPWRQRSGPRWHLRKHRDGQKLVGWTRLQVMQRRLARMEEKRQERLKDPNIAPVPPLVEVNTRSRNRAHEGSDDVYELNLEDFGFSSQEEGNIGNDDDDHTNFLRDFLPPTTIADAKKTAVDIDQVFLPNVGSRHEEKDLFAEAEALADAVESIKKQGYKVVVFDMDQTAVSMHSRGRLKRSEIEQFVSKTSNDFKLIVPALAEEGIKLAIATHSDEAEFIRDDVDKETHILGEELAREVLRRNFSQQLVKDFFIVAFNPRWRSEGTQPAFREKRFHMRKISEHFNVDPRSILFFDDNDTVAGDCNQTCNVRAIKVDPAVGFQLSDVPKPNSFRAR